MYVTRRLSQLRKSPEALAAPPDGPDSGYLVIQDEPSEFKSRSATNSWFGYCKDTSPHVPIPQDKIMKSYRGRILFIPVLNKPLRLNQYYAISLSPSNQHMGKAFVCTSEMNAGACCFLSFIKDAEPKSFDPRDVYQQMKIGPRQRLCNEGSLGAESVASDGIIPSFLNDGEIWVDHTAENYRFEMAEGINSEIRDRLPEFDFPLPSSLPPQFMEWAQTVGSWYCPFVFVKEGTVEDQVKKSMFYKIRLEQRWTKVITCRRDSSNWKSVTINQMVEKELSYVLDGMIAIASAWREEDGFVWFYDRTRRSKLRVGLRVEVVKRMRWEEANFGYSWGGNKNVKIERVEEYKGKREWSEFGLYALEEIFTVRRVDENIVMSYHFRHLDKIKTKWQ